jgi:hypothetical protein
MNFEWNRANATFFMPLVMVDATAEIPEDLADRFKVRSRRRCRRRLRVTHACCARRAQNIFATRDRVFLAFAIGGGVFAGLCETPLLRPVPPLCSPRSLLAARAGLAACVAVLVWRVPLEREEATAKYEAKLARRRVDAEFAAAQERQLYPVRELLSPRALSVFLSDAAPRRSSCSSSSTRSPTASCCPPCPTSCSRSSTTTTARHPSARASPPPPPPPLTPTSSRARGRSFLGITNALPALLQFFCNPVYGAFSDAAGRKPFMLLSAAGLVSFMLLVGIRISVASLLIAAVIRGLTDSAFTMACCLSLSLARALARSRPPLTCLARPSPQRAWSTGAAPATTAR